MGKNNEPKPGSFRDAAPPLGSLGKEGAGTGEPVSLHHRENEYKTSINQDLVETYNVLRNWIGVPIREVYYPACSVDVSPSSGFPNSHVLYVDIEEKPIEVLKRNGFDARVEDATGFVPEQPVDLLILLNPAISPSGPAQTVRERRIVACNNYHGTANDLRNNPQFEFVGVVSGKEGRVDTQDLEDYFARVQTDEDLKKTGLFDIIAQKVEKLIGSREHVVSEYSRLLQEAKEEGRDKEFGVPTLIKDGLPVVLYSLPLKKGHADSMYVFRKKGIEV